LNPALTAAIGSRIDALRAADPMNHTAIPVDLVTASGSGLDPQISVAAAYYQAERIARVRGVDLQRVRSLIAAQRQGMWLGLLGEPRINVLELNLALDELN
jgi:potassium-transporting ATPase KdpC subunit